MNGLPEFLLTPFGQGRKQQGRQDYDANFSDQYRDGKIERDAVETFFDNLLRGGSKKVQEAAQQQHIDALKDSVAGQYLMDERDRIIQATDTREGLRKAANKGKKEDVQIDRLMLAGYTGNPDDLKGKGAGAIAAMIPDQQRSTKSINFAEDPATKLLLANQREARRDRLADRADARAAQNRQYELQIMQLQQADKLKAQERKDRMFMTLMAGLQNLGQGFTI